MVKINVANPTTGQQKQFEIEDARKFLPFVDKRLAAEVPADHLGDEWKGYVLKLTGGSDKEGFPMLQGVLTNNRVKLLLTATSGCYHGLRKGERKRKSVRGCVVSADLAVLNAIVIKKGEKDIAGLTDKPLPQRLGPKRASKIRRLFNLQKQDDPRKYVVTYKRSLPLRVKEEVEEKRKYPRTKSVKIQRLVTPLSLQHKRRRVALRKNRRVASEAEAAEYAKLLETRRKAQREARASLLSARRSSRKTADAKPADGSAAAKPADAKKAQGGKKADGAKKAAAGGAKTDAKKAQGGKKADGGKKAAAGGAKPEAKKAQGGKK